MGSKLGVSVPRLEDDRFLTGAGRFCDDIKDDDAVWAVFVRSPYAHAKITTIETSAAQQCPGVVGIFLPQDLMEDGVGHMPCLGPVEGKGGTVTVVPPHPLLAQDRCLYAGEPVAIVVAETLAQAHEAADCIGIEADMLPVLCSTSDAVEDAAPQLWPEAPNNVSVEWEIGDGQATALAFQRASHVVSISLRNNRVAVNPIEPRSAIAKYDRDTGRYELTTPSQGVHGVRAQIAAHVLNVAEEQVRVITPDAGGGFGARFYCNREQIALLWAAKRIGRPVRWTAERTECFFCDGQARDHVSSARLALDDRGRFLGLDISVIANMGAYMIHWGASIPTEIGCEVLTGAYQIPSAHANVRCVFTNMVPIDTYRGTGRSEYIYLLERLVDAAARELEISGDELRRRNFVPPLAMPYTTPTAQTYDDANFEEIMDRAMRSADCAGLQARKAKALNSGRLVGMGMSYYVMSAAGLMDETARLGLEGDGCISLAIGTQSTGQGHATAYAQIASDALHVPVGSVKVIQGDSDACPAGGGTGQSRSVVMGGLAVRGAASLLIDRGRSFAAELMQVQTPEVRFTDGVFEIAGTDRSMSLSELAATLAAVGVPDKNLGAEYTATQTAMTFPNGCHICELAVDPDTGTVDVLAYTTVDDFGRLIHPAMCEGQVHGGTVQGVGQALLEAVAYDRDSGQLLSGSLMDYCLPRADDMPDMKVTMPQDLPCTTNALGAKGSGEAGSIAAPPAVINALLDALAPLGVQEFDMPATPERVWQAIRAARS